MLKAIGTGDKVRHIDGWRTETGMVEGFSAGSQKALIRWSNEPVPTWCRVEFLRPADVAATPAQG